MRMWSPSRVSWFAIAALGWLAVVPAAANDAPSVVVSIAPLHSLVAGVMGDVGTPELIVRGKASPHGYQMRPSQAAALNKADLVVWVGGTLEGFLKRPLARLDNRTRVVEAMAIDDMLLLDARAAGVWRDDDHDHDDGPDDPHVWLNPANAAALARHVAGQLGALDPANGATYAANAETLTARLEALDRDLAATLATVADRPFILFHDSTRYFVDHYGLNAVGAITVSPEHPPSARRLRRLRAAIRDLGVRCVFSEAQFESAMVRTVIEGTGAQASVIDPLAGTFAPGPDAYFQMMESVAEVMASCLSDG
jgi:zinc transport system substrate-binding protein